MAKILITTECKKCGSSDVGVKLIKEGQHITGSARNKSDSEFIRSSEYDFYWKWTAYKEHLLKSCNSCKNTWRTKCLDSL